MSQLINLAHGLKAKAKAHPDQNFSFNLSNGLRLRMTRSGIYWHLRLTRDNAPPSEGEVSIIRRDFDVPTEAYRTNAIQGCEHAVNLSWPESTLTP
jgi:hypothetical protein